MTHFPSREEAGALGCGLPVERLENGAEGFHSVKSPLAALWPTALERVWAVPPPQTIYVAPSRGKERIAPLADRAAGVSGLRQDRVAGESPRQRDHRPGLASHCSGCGWPMLVYRIRGRPSAHRGASGRWPVSAPRKARSRWQMLPIHQIPARGRGPQCWLIRGRRG
jgi:hypothetical protein